MQLSSPVLALLLFDIVLFVASLVRSGQRASVVETLFLSVLFLLSGTPALIYQIVWQRVLFSIYGVNSQSVAVVVSAFMIGLGLGSLLGGYLSVRFPGYAIRLFAAAELTVAMFGLCSLKLFHWFATFSSGASLGSVIVFSLVLLLLPTLLMGATLPLLTGRLVLTSGNVGASISRLYFVNTLGSAIACYLSAAFLLRAFSLSGAANIAALLNAIVGASAYLLAARSSDTTPPPPGTAPSAALPNSLPLGIAALLAFVSGFIALGYEIAWFRVFAVASSDRAPAFALLLATYLSGVAAGSFLADRFTAKFSHPQILRLIGLFLLLSGALSPFLPPLVGAILGSDLRLFRFLAGFSHHSYLVAAPLFFLVAALTGSVLPLLCRVAVAPDELAGRRVSIIYTSNILGSVLGSLGLGFVLTQYLGLRYIAIALGGASVVIGALVLLFVKSVRRAPVRTSVLALACAAALPLAASQYSLFFERLFFHRRPESKTAFTHLVENRNGVVAVLSDGSVFASGVYDGAFRIDPAHDTNLIVRALALGAIHPRPRRILIIGLASGSWAQVLIHNPQVESMDIVEINPGYLPLIRQYPVVSSLLSNPKARIFVDDGRRWLLAHPDEKYDLIVANSTYHWRDHASALLSADFYRLVRLHLQPGGIHYFNSTESDGALATALSVFPYGLRVINFLAVSDSPIQFDTARWISLLRVWRLEDRSLFDPLDPSSEKVLAAYEALAATLNSTPRFFGLETGDSLRHRLGKQRLITDDNMGLEWDPSVATGKP